MADVHPVQEMKPNGRGFQSKCPKLECGSPMPEFTRVEIMAPPETTVTQTAETPAEHRGVPLRYELSTAQPVENDLVAMSRARLVAVELRLSELPRLEAEARRLRAMIAAADATETN